MMWRYGLICWLIFRPLSAQEAVDIKDSPPIVLLQFADQLYQDENFDVSITEYQRFLFFHAEHVYTFYAYYKIGMAYKQMHKWKSATSFLRYALHSNIPTELRQRIRYQLALVLIAEGDFDVAQIELFKLSSGKYSSQITDAAKLIYGLLLTNQKKWQDAKISFKQFHSREGLNLELADYLRKIEVQLDHLIKQPQKKSPKLAKWLSTFVPGSGQIYSGKLLTGLNALALNAGTTYFLWHTIEAQSVRDAILVFSFVWLRYYSGNRLHAEEAAIRANRASQEKIYENIYNLLQQAMPLLSDEPLTIEWQNLSLLRNEAKK